MNQSIPTTATSRQLIYEVISGGTGFVLALFMWGHVVLVGSILTGERGFNWMATMLEDYFIAQPTVIAIFTLFLTPAAYVLIAGLSRPRAAAQAALAADLTAGSKPEPGE